MTKWSFDGSAPEATRVYCSVNLIFLDYSNQKTGGRGASRAGALVDDRDGDGLWFGAHTLRLE